LQIAIFSDIYKIKKSVSFNFILNIFLLIFFFFLLYNGIIKVKKKLIHNKMKMDTFFVDLINSYDNKKDNNLYLL